MNVNVTVPIRFASHWRSVVAMLLLPICFLVLISGCGGKTKPTPTRTTLSHSPPPVQENLAEAEKAVERKDYSSALKTLQPLAEQGRADAQYRLGTMHQGGLGVPRNSARAFEWFQKAALQGNAEAQDRLGVMFYEGIGVKHDNVKAVEWYRQAADQGLASAQNHLGFMYREGLGVAKDNREAVEWYRKAAEQGLASAQYRLGFMYAKGLGVQKDPDAAAVWYRKAAEQGHEPAIRHLESPGYDEHRQRSRNRR